MGTGVEIITTSNVRKIGGKAINDGVQLGVGATSKVGFFGTAPVVQPSITAVGTTTATTAINETRISRLYAALESIGIVATTS